ncbi:ABC transporter ATP-binding protein [Nonomuraea diastatica]|uniref:ABC transporter ATP-binding protein n=1 Tax=Nonomuraea diastatica TaxID=1848329 RepID=UPI001FECB6CE|nr:ABC transporter ATP-binding protein [Nonomuraea diastatica]
MTVLARAIDATRRYGDVLALDHVSLDIRAGELVGLLGPNGAGTAELLGRFGLADLARRQVGGLSGGQRRRLAVALAFAGKPRLVFLDEPTTGLDVEARRALWEGIRSFHEKGGTVLLTSHYLEEIEALAERVLVVGHGRVLADGTVRAVRGLVGTRRVSLVAEHLPHLPGVLGAERSGGRIDLVVNDPDRLVGSSAPCRPRSWGSAARSRRTATCRGTRTCARCPRARSRASPGGSCQHWPSCSSR